MTRTLLLSLVLLAVAAAPASAAPLPQKCKRGETVASNSQARVFEVVRGDHARLFACRRSDGRRQQLEHAVDDGFTTTETIRYVRLAGRFVAWDFESTDISCKADCPPEYDPTREYASVADLRRRSVRRLHEIGARQLGLTRTGVLAWTSGADGDVSVFKSAGLGQTELLDRGAVTARSLRVKGLTASWLKDGARQSARIG